MKSKLISISLLAVCALTCQAGYTVYIREPGTCTNSPPYTNGWTSAGTNLIEAASSIGTGVGVNTILVSNGTYYLTNQILFTATNWGANLKSLNGRNVTIIDGNSPNNTNGCIGCAGALNTVDGFTIRNGYRVGGNGGGINADRTYIYNCRIINNVCTNGSGGGIYGGGNPTTITNCDIINNTVYAGGGGGIWSSEAGNVVNIYGCNIISNKAVGISGDATAGGIRIDSSCSISNCVIAYNSVTNTIAGNAAAAGGIQMYNNSIMRNCLIFGNRAKNGGGVYVYSGRVGCGPNQIESCTIVSNYASSAGGGLYQFNPTYTNHVENCIVYYNSAGDGVSSNIAYQAYLTITTGAFECVNTCLAPTSSIPTEWPAGVPLNNTGNTQSDPRLVNYPAGDCRLNANSPCVNSGTNRDWMTNAVDLDGRMRKRYGTVDMGAYEVLYHGSIFGIR